EGEITRDRKCCDNLGTCDEGMRVRVPIVAFREVPVEAGDDRILAVRIISMPRPLTDTGAAGVRQHHPADLIEGLQDAIAFGGETHLLTSRGYGEFALRLQFLVRRLFGDTGASGKILVA